MAEKSLTTDEEELTAEVLDNKGVESDRSFSDGLKAAILKALSLKDNSWLSDSSPSKTEQSDSKTASPYSAEQTEAKSTLSNVENTRDYFSTTERLNDEIETVIDDSGDVETVRDFSMNSDVLQEGCKKNEQETLLDDPAISHPIETLIDDPATTDEILTSTVKPKREQNNDDTVHPVTIKDITAPLSTQHL